MFFAESFDYKGANVLHCALAGDQTTYRGIKPAQGVKNVNFLCWVYLDEAANVVVNVATADAYDGTNITTPTETVPIWIQGVRQTDAKAFTFLSTLTANVYHSACVQVPANLVPASKYVGVYLTAGNAANLLTAIAINDTYYKG